MTTASIPGIPKTVLRNPSNFRLRHRSATASQRTGRRRAARRPFKMGWVVLTAIAWFAAHVIIELLAHIIIGMPVFSSVIV